ncbi:ATP-binding domain-containing protein [uncultured Zoogloea sp.]|uniref:ATP-binding domain-containing protein n=1 Tax=uncultured Zoogloea sp. TaxID=160237 RepID=UPI00262852BC|nr:ATP-binding domain-containing protein [uncultured Zoogloea sp.]
MAIVHPAGWRELAATGAAQREIETLAQLADGLSDDYTIFHGVHWTRIHQGRHAIVGEIDFAIVGPTGKLLLVEQKSGFLAETPGGLVKRYGQKDKQVAMQLARNVDALTNRLRAVCDGEPIEVDALLFCPDYTVRAPGTAGIDPARIVDATRRQYLVEVIRAILPASGPRLINRAKVERFLGDVLALVPEVHAIVGEAHALYTRLAGGLADWARRIDFTPFRLRVVGTAGSGKTQLAMAAYRDALAAGRQPMYVCYNRPLADHIALIAPPGGVVVTYHQLADRLLRARGEAPDFTRPDAFARLEAALDDLQPADAEQVDELIIDEGQDFQAGWARNLLRFLRPGGRAWWLEDPLQNLYARPPVDLPGWVVLHADTNYRSPRDILTSLNRLLPGRGVEAGSPIEGAEVEIISYTGPDDLAAASTRALTRAVGLGFKRPHIALVTYRGREHSRLTPLTRLGNFPLKAPTGRYDLLGNPILTDGDVLIDSVHRFKGRAAPCVILTEIDFTTLDDAAIRRLFVGATRATLKLILVATDSAAAVLRERLLPAS